MSCTLFFTKQKAQICLMLIRQYLAVRPQSHSDLCAQTFVEYFLVACEQNAELQSPNVVQPSSSAKTQWSSVKKGSHFQHHCIPQDQLWTSLVSHLVCSKTYLQSEDYLFSLCIFHIRLIGLFRIAFCGEFLKELWENIHTVNPHCGTEMYQL